MYSLILSLVLSTQVYADRANVEVDGKNCIIKHIKYNEVDNLIYAVGNCDIIYEMCEETFCTVEKLPQKDLYFSTENVGQK